MDYQTLSGVPVKNHYSPYDIENFCYEESLGDPGGFPFARGKHPSMYRERLWITRELCGLESPHQTNARLKYLISQGQSGLAIVPDTPSQLGIDSDHPMAIPSCGVQGVPICRVEDMEELLEGIDLASVTSSFSLPGVMVPVLISQFLLVADGRGYDRKILRGSVQNDPIQAAVTGYDPRNPLEMTLRLGVDTIEFCAKEMPSWHCSTVNAYDLRESGINAIQEIAYTFSIAMVYINEVLKRGLSIDEFAHRILIVSGAHIDLFEEIAKFRAARRIWAKLMRDKYNARNSKTQALSIAVHTAGCSLTQQQSVNNIVRSAYEALAAVLGGCQGLDLSSYDEGYCIPSEEGAMVSLRTQQILAYETGVTNTVDPLGGSYYVEWLTDTLEKEIWRVMDEIEKRGGILNAVKSGWLSQEIENASNKYQEEIETGRRKLIGVNVFQIPPAEDTLLPINKSHNKPSQEQVQRVEKWRKGRNAKRIEDSLRALYSRAKNTSDNLVPYIFEAVRSDASLGEIIGTIRLAYGCSYDPYGILSYPYDVEGGGE